MADSEIAERLTRAREGKGYARRDDAAKAFGWNVNTYKSHETNQRGIPIEEIKKYARALSVSPQWLIFGGNKDIVREFAYLAVKGIVQAGVWSEGNEDGFGYDSDGLPEQSMPIAPDPRYQGVPQYLLKVSGNSMNQYVKPGQYVHCIDFAASGIGIEEGQVVHVERIRSDGGLHENTLKKVRIVRGAFELWPESDDDNHKTPITLSNGEEGVDVHVRGVVIGRYIPD